MSLIGRLLGPPSRKTVDASALTWQLLGGVSSKSGATVTVDSSLRVSAVLACVRALAEDLAQLPVHVLQEDAEGHKRPAKEHALYRVLHDRPNEFQTSFEWREQAMYHATLTSGYYAIVNRAGGQVDELLPVDPQRVQVVQDRNWGTAYAVDSGLGNRAVFTRDEMLHVRGPSWNGYAGMDAVRMLSEAIGLSIATEESQARLHGQGVRPAGVLSTDKELKADTIKRLRADIKQTYTGYNGNMETLVLDAGFRFSPMSLTGVDAQTLESRRFQVEEIARAFGIPPARIGYSDKTSTYASAEQFLTLYFRSALAPWVERWEESLTRTLLSDADVREGYLIRFNVKGFLRADVKSQAEYYQRALGNTQQPGWMSVNDIRRLEDMDTVEGEKYEEPYFPEAQASQVPETAPKADPAGQDPEDDPQE